MDVAETKSLLGQLSDAVSGLPQQQRLKILLVDHDAASRCALQNIIMQAGYDVLAAEDGAAAISIFIRDHPDVILLEAALPGMGGHQVARYLREFSGDLFTPILFLYDLSEEEALADCMVHGFHDFLLKTSTAGLIKSKLESYAQLRSLYHAVRQQRDELSRHRHWMTREYEIAAGVFSKVMHSDDLQAPNIKYLISPQAIFNGDLLLAAYRPSGALHLLLGDFTGHGLSAAIGTIPVADIFNGMTAKGFPIQEIVAEINQKLQRILPRGIFFAAAILELDFNSRSLSAWVGGVPDVLVYCAVDKRIIGRFASNNFPLGVMDTNQLDCQVESMEVAEGDRIFLCTDGVSEARNLQGEMFGRERLEGCFASGHESSALFEHILLELDQFRGDQKQSDDVTLIEVRVETPSSQVRATGGALTPRAASTWRTNFEFGFDTLKAYDPVPVMMQVLLETQRLHQYKQRIYIVLSELFVNALEHGLLHLDSTLKDSPGGFGTYYKEKEQRLANLTEGTIAVELRHEVMDNGGQLTICVKDSGSGFDFTARLKQINATQAPHGRGLLLVDSLCESLCFSGKGNIVEACYRWYLQEEKIESAAA